MCDNDDGLYHEGIVNLNLSTLDNVRDYVKHYITDHPTDNEVPFNNDYCRSDDLREVYDYASAVIVAKIIGITDNSNKDIHSTRCGLYSTGSRDRGRMGYGAGRSP